MALYTNFKKFWMFVYFGTHIVRICRSSLWIRVVGSTSRSREQKECVRVFCSGWKLWMPLYTIL